MNYLVSLPKSTRDPQWLLANDFGLSVNRDGVFTRRFPPEVEELVRAQRDNGPFWWAVRRAAFRGYYGYHKESQKNFPFCSCPQADQFVEELENPEPMLSLLNMVQEAAGYLASSYPPHPLSLYT